MQQFHAEVRVTTVFVVMVLFWSTIAIPAMAQVEPGRIEDRFKKPVTPRSRIIVKGLEINETIPPAEAQKIRFTPKTILVEGSSIYSPEDLQSLYAGILGKEVSLLSIFELVNKITRKYGEDGYTLSRAYLPPQRIGRNSVVRIKILEGYIDGVIVDGEFMNARSFFESYKEKITQERPINTRTLERYLLLANDLPGITVQSVLRRSETNPGASTLLLRVEQKQINASVSVDNRGTKAQGPIQVYGSFTLNNPFGMFSETSGSYVQALPGKELRYFAFSNQQTLNSEGTTLKLSASKNNSEPGTAALTLLNQESDSFRLSAAVTHPVIRSRQENLSISARYDHSRSRNFLLNTLNSKDKLRVLRFQLNYDRSDEFQGINQILIEASQGLNLFGATKDSSPVKSRAGGKPDFTKLTLNVSRTQQLGVFSPALNPLSLYVSGSGQFAFNELLSPEECGYGGQVFGRGYDPSEILGDHCAMGSVELRFNTSINSNSIDYTQIYGFADAGKVWNKNPAVGTPKSESLSSVGLGVRASLFNAITGSFELAFPMEKTGNTDKGARAFFRINANY